MQAANIDPDIIASGDRKLEQLLERSSMIELASVERWLEAAGEPGETRYFASYSIWIRPQEFEQKRFEAALECLTLHLVGDGLNYLGLFEPAARFRLYLWASNFRAPPREGFHFVPSILPHIAPDVAEALQENVALAAHLLANARYASLQADTITSGLTLNRAIDRLTECLTIFSWRSLHGSRSRLPFGPYREVAASLSQGDFEERYGKAAFVVSKIWSMLQDLDHPLSSARRQAFTSIMFPSGSPSQADWVSIEWYDRHRALQYEDVRSLPPRVIEILRSLVEQLGGGDAVDLGCGTGRVSLPLAPALDRLVGVDSSAAMLERFDQRSSRMSGRHGISSVQAGMCSSGLPTQSADLLFEHESFCFFPYPGLIAFEIDRILQPTGHALRLVRTTQEDPLTEQALNTFHRVIARSNQEGIAFVGEVIDDELDSALDARGFESLHFEFHTEREDKQLSVLLRDLENRAYPYLASVPDEVLHRALSAAKEISVSHTSILEHSYELIVSRRRDAEHILSAEDLHNLLEPHAPGRRIGQKGKG